MNLAQIESNVQDAVKKFNQDTFIYDLLLAYDHPRASISRLQNGGLNLSKVEGEIAWKKKLFFKFDLDNDLHELIDNLKTDNKVTKFDPRFIIATDYDTFLAIDTKTDETLDVPILDIGKHFDFFLPWAGMEKAQRQSENPADVKAAERMAKLYDEIKKDNPTKTKEEVHNLNVFLSCLLFCFFAEDTGIFEDAQFTSAIGSHTQQDGSDLNTYLDKLFQVMNTEQGKRKNLPAYLDAFPYVNGGLFRDKRNAPIFTRRSRQAVIESGELDWSAINPDIFGSMIQAVISPEHRGVLGMHYTSVPNIMKVIEPLFLDDLKKEFEAARGNKKQLNQLLHRISKIKIFDPACGSGNFLIIAYKQLRRLEMDIFKETNSLAYSGISLSNFYGIEIDDFAHEIAILSLWLAEHQMNKEFFDAFGRTKPPLPLIETGNIIHGNATRLDWEKVCPKNEGDEIYILGNPPYVGAKLQNQSQREDLALVFSGVTDYKNLDYIGCWFLKSSNYISNTNFEAAFVSTKSVIQGNQVGLLWPNLYNNNIEIGFAYPPFKWTNNARDKAGVQVVIFSIRSDASKKKKYLFQGYKKNVENIGPYLNEGPTLIISSRRKAISNLPEMVFGNMPLEGNHLKLSEEEKNRIISSNHLSSKFIRPLIGGDEFLNSIQRYCLWIENRDLIEAENIQLIKERINKVREFRMTGGDVARTLVDRSHQFRYRRVSNNGFILVPCTTSERRTYMQCGFFNENIIPIHSAQVIYDSEPYIFSILSCKMHMLWVKSVGGYLGTSIRYSTEICYNSFPFPSISESQKNELDTHVYNILEEREKHSEKTIAQLYDPDKMPVGLREAHRLNDLAIERCYRSKPFESDEERMEFLFKLYEKMIVEEKEKGTLFQTETKLKKQKK